MSVNDLSITEKQGIFEFVRRKWNVHNAAALRAAVDNFLQHHPDAEHLLAAIQAAAEPDMEWTR